jgi:hypothetical protein
MKCRIQIVLFIFGLLVANQAMCSQTGLDQPTNQVKAVTMKWVELLDNGALPGMSAKDHGNVNVYQLTDAMEKLLLEKKTIETNMLNDVKNYSRNDCYVAGVTTTDDRSFTYFFYVANGSVELLSAYRYDSNAWVRIRK